MPRSTLFSSALRDLGDDIAHHAMGLAHGAFDLTCVVALGLAVFASGIDSPDAGLAARPQSDVQAHMGIARQGGDSAAQAPTPCSLANDIPASSQRDCITAMVLDPLDA